VEIALITIQYPWFTIPAVIVCAGILVCRGPLRMGTVIKIVLIALVIIWFTG
jgi:hypothetical protein